MDKSASIRVSFGVLHEHASHGSRRPAKIAIALGDPAGIGPEIALKAVLDPRVRAACRPILVGDLGALQRHAQACGLSAAIEIAPSFEEAGSGAGVEMIDLRQFTEESMALGEVSAAHGRAAVAAATAAVEAAMAGHVEAVVACPQTELAIKQAGIDFDGYPSLVARCTGIPTEDAFLMLCFDHVRIVHTTLHVGLRQAIDLVTSERIQAVLAAADTTLKRLGVECPRIAVSGLNPHASEHGMFGDEEGRIIEPAIAAAQGRGVNADGPFGADTMFHKIGYDAFVVMYHDQGHLAAKLLATNRTAGMTIGTPVLFSSVAHGSALDIAGQNKASPEAVVEAVLRLAGAAMRARSLPHDRRRVLGLVARILRRPGGRPGLYHPARQQQRRRQRHADLALAGRAGRGITRQRRDWPAGHGDYALAFGCCAATPHATARLEGAWRGRHPEAYRRGRTGGRAQCPATADPGLAPATTRCGIGPVARGGQPALLWPELSIRGGQSSTRPPGGVLVGSRHRRTVPVSMSNMSSKRPSVWSIISSRLLGLA